MPKWLHGEVIEIQSITPELRLFRVFVDTDYPESFTPGQFVVMDLPISEKRIGRWRSYSIANTPNQEKILEFCVSKIEGGQGSTYLFDDIRIGSELRFKPPAGTFTILNHLQNELVLICTGTGVAPFRSMLKHIFDDQLEFKYIHLIYGTRYKKNLLYHDEFLDMMEKKRNFHYTPALSKETYGNYRGRVHDIYLDLYPENKKDIKFYLCGWQNMIDEAVKNLLTIKKQPAKNIVYELYG